MRALLNNPRIESLDGLRGFAAVVVLLHHSLLIDSWFADAVVSATAIEGGGLKRFIYYTPLHLPFLGSEAVLVFFTLSGFVLARSYPGLTAFRVSYLIPRLARLYLPIWAALCVSIGLLFARPAGQPKGMSWWSEVHFKTVSIESLTEKPDSVLKDFLVIPGTSWLDSSLWSMRFEISASIILVLLVFLNRFGLSSVIGAVIVSLLAKDLPASWFTSYLPYFVAGMTLHRYQKPVSRVAGNLLGALGIAAFLFPWISRGLGYPVSDPTVSLLLSLFGAAGLTIGALHGGLFSQPLRSPIGQYFGSRSYSLYLIHAPIIALCSFWFYSLESAKTFWPIASFFALAASIFLGEAFYQLVEVPSLRLSRRIRSGLKKREK